MIWGDKEEACRERILFLIPKSGPIQLGKNINVARGRLRTPRAPTCCMVENHGAEDTGAQSISLLCPKTRPQSILGRKTEAASTASGDNAVQCYQSLFLGTISCSSREASHWFAGRRALAQHQAFLLLQGPQQTSTKCTLS